MTEQRAVGHAALERRFEGIHVVDALAGVGALAAEILIHVGDGGGVGIDAVHAGEDALEERPLAADRQRRRDARLQHAVALDDASRAGIEPRLVQRVRHLADQPPGRFPRHPGIGVERDDVADAGGRSGRRGKGRGAVTDEGRIGRAAEQPVQLMQLAALAFPSDPPRLPWIPDPPAMQQEEARPAGCRSIAAIEAFDARGHRADERRITLDGLGRGVRPVRQQREVELALRAGEVMDFQPLDLLFDCGLRREQDRNGHDGAQRRRDAVAQLEARQDRRTEPFRDAAVHERHRGIDGGDQPEEREQTEPLAADIRTGQREQRQEENGRGDDDDGADIAADTDRRIEATQPVPNGRTKSDRPLERPATPRNQVIARVPLAAAASACGRQRRTRNLEFAQRRTARKLLDRAPIKVARREIHRREVAAGTQRVVDETDALDERRPVDVGDQPHARDDVADRHVRRALSLVLVAHHLVRGRCLRGEASLEPRQGRRHPRVLVPQPLHELDGKRLRQGGLLVIAQEQEQGDRVGRVGRMRVHAQEPVGQGVCFLACGAARHDAARAAAKVLDEHDPQRDRDRPQLPDRQRLNALVGAHEPAQHLGVEATVRMSDEGPRHAEHPRIAGERSGGQLRQLPVVAGGRSSRISRICSSTRW